MCQLSCVKPVCHACLCWIPTVWTNWPHNFAFMHIITCGSSIFCWNFCRCTSPAVSFHPHPTVEHLKTSCCLCCVSVTVQIALVLAKVNLSQLLVGHTACGCGNSVLGPQLFWVGSIQIFYSLRLVLIVVSAVGICTSLVVFSRQTFQTGGSNF